MAATGTKTGERGGDGNSNDVGDGCGRVDDEGVSRLVPRAVVVRKSGQWAAIAKLQRGGSGYIHTSIPMRDSRSDSPLVPFHATMRQSADRHRETGQEPVNDAMLLSFFFSGLLRSRCRSRARGHERNKAKSSRIAGASLCWTSTRICQGWIGLAAGCLLGCCLVHRSLACQEEEENGGWRGKMDPTWGRKCGGQGALIVLPHPPSSPL